MKMYIQVERTAESLNQCDGPGMSHGFCGKSCLPVWIIDEAQNLPNEFFRDFPSFQNFACDSKAMMTVWLVGHPRLKRSLQLAHYEALTSRIQVRASIEPFQEAKRFAQLIEHALTTGKTERKFVSH